ncbi:MAG: LysM peptidoglycan-binding domain-containing protein [Acidimicrobiales bacterium]
MGARRFVTPDAGDDLDAVADRLGLTADDLRSWNLHLATRRSVGLLPSDIVFAEPPPAAG